MFGEKVTICWSESHFWTIISHTIGSYGYKRVVACFLHGSVSDVPHCGRVPTLGVRNTKFATWVGTHKELGIYSVFRMLINSTIRGNSCLMAIKESPFGQ